MTGQQQKSPRWKECTQGPTSWLPLAAGSMYVREHFDANDKKEALEMIANLRESFSELVQENDWMDEQTKHIAIEKVCEQPESDMTLLSAMLILDHFRLAQ